MGSVEEEPTLADKLDDAVSFLKEMERAALRLHGSSDEVQMRLRTTTGLMTTAETDEEELQQVVKLLQKLEGVWQKTFQKSVARVISRGLTLVFEEPMELNITTRILRDVSNVEFKIVQGEGKDAIETDLLGAKGGTVIALVNVLIRALLIMSARPTLRRIMILDEPFGLADDSYIPAFGALLREMCDKLKFQIIIVSHEEALVDVADMAYEVYKTKRKGSSFRQIRSRNEVHA